MSLYKELLKGVTFISFIENSRLDVEYNYAYFPIHVNTAEYGMSRDDLYLKMQEHDIFGRRYFYPLICDFPTYRGMPSAKADNLPVATQVAKEILCLPIYPHLEKSEIKKYVI